MRAFTVWARANRRLRDNPMEGVSGFNAEEDQGYARRSLTEREFGQLIAAALANDLRSWLAGKALGESVPPRHHGPAKMIRADLEAAGIPYETEEGFADFHALRGFYVSALIKSAANIKTLQTLARHSNPSLTIKRYAKANTQDVVEAVQSLPNPAMVAPVRRSLPAQMDAETSAITPAVHGSDLPVDTIREGSAPVASCRSRASGAGGGNGPTCCGRKLWTGSVGDCRMPNGEGGIRTPEGL
ncbi:site-specific integrase [Singulisphaera rosea]